MGKKEKYGNYLCKIGYLDVRQKIDMPRSRRLNNGEKQYLRINCFRLQQNTCGGLTYA